MYFLQQILFKIIKKQIAKWHFFQCPGWVGRMRWMSHRRMTRQFRRSDSWPGRHMPHMPRASCRLPTEFCLLPHCAYMAILPQVRGTKVMQIFAAQLMMQLPSFFVLAVGCCFLDRLGLAWPPATPCKKWTVTMHLHAVAMLQCCTLLVTSLMVASCCQLLQKNIYKKGGDLCRLQATNNKKNKKMGMEMGMGMRMKRFRAITRVPVASPPLSLHFWQDLTGTAWIASSHLGENLHFSSGCCCLAVLLMKNKYERGGVVETRALGKCHSPFPYCPFGRASLLAGWYLLLLRTEVDTKNNKKKKNRSLASWA